MSIPDGEKEIRGKNKERNRMKKDVVERSEIPDGTRPSRNEEKEEERLPSYPREEHNECIKPCPRYQCLMTPSGCDKNCNRREALLDPCSLCEHDCDDHLQTILLKPEVMKYQEKTKRDFNKNFLYKSDVAERIVDLQDKKDKLKQAIKQSKKELKDHPLPTFMAKKLSASKLDEYKLKYQKVKSQIDELEYNFNE